MKVGAALGSGGAKGLAHVPMLDVFDELGIEPDIVDIPVLDFPKAVEIIDQAQLVREDLKAALTRHVSA